MKTSIFIKTWSGDIPWLKYCLQSIKLYGSGFEEVVIVADESCVQDVYPIADGARVIPVGDWTNGYIQQQWVKLNADQYTDADQILFVDSDCVFHTPFTPESYMRDGKPILLKTDYQLLGSSIVWQAITSDFVGWYVDYEYMRRLPWMYKRSSLQNFRKTYLKLYNHLYGMEDRSFSEFNVLGAYIDRFEKDQYYISDTSVWMSESVAEQFWSWGGITPEIQTRINQYLKCEVSNAV